MDQFTAIYQQMMEQQNTKANSTSSGLTIESIQNQLLTHTKYLAQILPDKEKQELKFIMAMIDPNMLQCHINIVIEDQIYFKFAILFSTNKIQFYAIPDIYLIQMKPQIPAITFATGSDASYNPSNTTISIFTQRPKFKRSFIKQRKEQKRKREELQNQIYKPREESMQDVWLQYASYFRNK